MRQILLFLIELLVAYFLIGHVLVRNLLPRRRKALQALKEHERYVKKLRKVHYDLLSGESCEKLKDLGGKLHRIRKSRGTTESDISEAIEETDNVCASYVPRKYRNRSMIAEYLEIAVVALGIAFAVRGFALQPFKIPTGSMEPTMYGIHFVEKKELHLPNPLEKIFGYLHYSRRYVDATIKKAGRLQSIKPVSTLPFMNAVEVTIADHTYRLPGKFTNVKDYLPEKVAEFLKKSDNKEGDIIVLEGEFNYEADSETAIYLKPYQQVISSNKDGHAVVKNPVGEGTLKFKPDIDPAKITDSSTTIIAPDSSNVVSGIEFELELLVKSYRANIIQIAGPAIINNNNFIVNKDTDRISGISLMLSEEEFRKYREEEINMEDLKNKYSDLKDEYLSENEFDGFSSDYSFNFFDQDTPEPTKVILNPGYR